MSTGKRLCLCLAGLSLLCCSWMLLPARANDTEPPVKIGMVKTLFTDVPKPLVQVVLGPFGALMKDFTGLDGKVVLGGDAMSLAKDLDEGKVDLAVFHGVEYAWARTKYPQLKPLMVAITKYKHARAHLVVRKEMESTAIADLKGKVASLPLGSREHCRLFLSRACSECGSNAPKDFFEQLVPSANIERALDDLCIGTVDVVVTDTVALENYHDVKPGCHARLRILKDSENFPTGLIAYREGTLSQEKLTKLRTGLVNGNKTDRGREIMSLFRITSFEPVPEDYNQTLSDILKAYPVPESATPVSAPR